MEAAAANFEALRQNPYPGRGIIVGLDESGGFLVQVYWIMGRSENSRNRVFEAEGGRLWTAAADPAKLKDPSLIIYNAMRETNGDYVVSNGDQTDTIVQGLLVGSGLRESLNTRCYEPDAPNFTPRISAHCRISGQPQAELSILKKSPLGAGCDRFLFRIEQFAPALGHCLCTYDGDGEPLPPFSGEPRILPLEGEIDCVGRQYWNALNQDNRVALAVKFIRISDGHSEILLINRYRKKQG